MYPAMLALRDWRVLVVGGGEVALHKVEGLIAQGARVTVVSPECCAGLDRLALGGDIDLRRRRYRDGDAGGYALVRDANGFGLVFAATDDREVNARVSAEARAAGIWVNVADDPELCTFHLPARVERGAFQIAIASGGEAPFVVRRLRQLLERRFGPEWAEWMEAAGRFRQTVRALDLPREAQERAYDRFFGATVDSDRLRARVPASAEIATWVETRGGAGPRRIVPFAPPARLAPVARPALVSLVGAGPGDPGLLTVRARQRLLAAAAVVYDRLAAAALPCDLGSEVELHCVGKEAGHHSVPQDEINALLVRLSLAGKRTVRLKGGDPFVFGRGGEEAEALRSAGVPYEVVPGVTAALGATACAGIPVTHRRESVRLTLVTGHECGSGDRVRWDLLAQDPHATLVGYMGLSNLPTVADRLVAAGMSPGTPAALIAQGATPAQRTVVSTLGGLHAAGVAAGIAPPALFVIGPTVHHAATLDWFASRPLSGERLGLFAPAGDLAAALDMAGAGVIEMPRPLTAAARVVLEAAPVSAWVLRSVREVDALEDERAPRAFCIGPAAAARARQLGWPGVVELRDSAGPDAIAAAIGAPEEERTCNL
jgi:uroporphyrin-III C-methyltransferase/precorrin-2 dehydrogenase/sirohydrochlorin ferrochelatase